MTDHQQAFKEAEKELAKERIDEIKNTMKLLLQKIQDQKEVKEKAEENIRLLKLDMEDLRAGKIEKIQERHEQSRKAREISPITYGNLTEFASLTATTTSTNAYGVTSIANAISWPDATGGTYIVTASNGTIKEFNL